MESLLRFSKNKISIKSINISSYQSNLLNKYNFYHDFFCKNANLFSKRELINYKNSNLSIHHLRQIHSNKIINASLVVNSESNGDGLINDKKDQSLWIYTSDCMPILIADKKQRIISAIHCGWRGIENMIISNTIIELLNRNSILEDIIVAIGPSISQRNYKVREDVYKKISTKLSYSENSNNIKYHKLISENIFERINSQEYLFSLQKAAVFQFISFGIKREAISIAKKCTFKLSSEFNSWRRDKKKVFQWSYISN